MTAESGLRSVRRVALVTGGSRRIGRAICVALAQAGYSVVVHGLHPTAAGRELVDEICDHGVGAFFVPADLSDPGSVDGLIKRARAATGGLSLLVNNASEYEADAFGNLDAERWQRQFAVNLTTPVFLAQAFAAQVPADAEAAIINITDQRVRKAVPRHFSYTLTKFALDAATVMMAQALAPRIRVNAVAPGPTLASPRQDEAAFAAQQAALPLGRGPSPEDVAAAVVYLAGARMVTGETIAVDGGQHVAWQTPDATGPDE